MKSYETTPHIPLRFREHSFRRYEDVISLIVSTFPMVRVFDSIKDYELSPTTFSNRLRDAMTSLRRFRWATNIDLPVFDTLWPDQIVVSERDGKVFVGSRDSLREVETYKPTSKAVSADVWELDWAADSAEVAAVVALCHRRRLVHVKLIVTNLPASQATLFESSFDVSLEPVEGRPDTYTLL